MRTASWSDCLPCTCSSPAPGEDAAAPYPERSRRPAAGQVEEVISYLRENEITLTDDQATGSLHAGGAATTITLKAG